MNYDQQPSNEFQVHPELWTVDTLKSKLLEGSNGRLPALTDVPKILRLNGAWTNVLEDIFYIQSGDRNGFATFQMDHPEENARVVKTDKDRKKIFIQSSNQLGSNDKVSVNSSGVEIGEYYLGIFHKHPVKANFSSEDILSMMYSRGHLISGLVDPENYYLAIKTKESYTLPTDNILLARGYALAMARKHGAYVTRHSDGNDGFEMTNGMFKELNIALYVGKRRQEDLKLTSI